MNAISAQSHKHGRFGQTVKLPFYFFNIFMAIRLISYLILLAKAPAAFAGAEKAGVLIGLQEQEFLPVYGVRDTSF